MSVGKIVEISQVLVFKDDKSAKIFGPAVWAAFEEVRRFFGSAGDRFEVMVGDGTLSVIVEPKFTFSDLSRDASPAGSHSLAPIWKKAQTGSATYDHQTLGELVKMIGQLPGTAVIVTDVEIEPPSDWRYIIWSAFPEGVVASLAPLDPWYWGDRVPEPERISMVKARVRAANISIVGQLLGLSRCDNDRCFLFADVDSVTRLDEMTHLGPEHGVKELAYRGFSLRSSSPEVPEELVQDMPETA